MAGVTLLFYFGGLIESTFSSTLLDLVLRPERFQSSSLVLTIASLGAFVLGLVSTFIARNQNSDFYLMIPLVEIFLSFGWDFVVVYQQMAAISEAARIVTTLILGPFILGYVITVVEWWRGLAP